MTRKSDDSEPRAGSGLPRIITSWDPAPPCRYYVYIGRSAGQPQSRSAACGAVGASNARPAGDALGTGPRAAARFRGSGGTDLIDCTTQAAFFWHLTGGKQGVVLWLCELCDATFSPMLVPMCRIHTRIQGDETPHHTVQQPSRCKLPFSSRDERWRGKEITLGTERSDNIARRVQAE